MDVPAKPTRLPSVDAPVGRARPAPRGQDDLQSQARIKTERDLYKRLLDLAHVADPGPFLKEALALIVEFAGAQQAYLELYDDDHERAWWTSLGFSDSELDEVRTCISRGIIAKAVAGGELLVTPSAMLDPRFSEFDSVRIGQIQAVMCTPIGNDPVRGVLYLQGRDHPGLYTEDERYSARMFAMQLAPLVNLLTRASEPRRDALRGLRERIDIDGVIGSSPAIVRILEQLATLAPLDAAVLLTGETGTGKSQFARLIHRNSTRRDGPFVEVNCGSLRESLAESELFGTVPGAFTDAVDRAGKIEAAHGGTLFLDEIGDLPLDCQVKLLQVLQSHEFSRLGSTETRFSDFRLVTATNVDLEQAVKDKRFREDLYFRLDVLQIRMPSLAERREDIATLAAYFCEQHCRSNRLPALQMSRGAIVAAELAEWTGNVRELSHAVLKAIVGAAQESATQVERRHLFPDQPEATSDSGELTFQEATRRFQAGLLREALENNDWNISETARRLDVARSHVHNLIKTFNLHKNNS